MKITLELKDGGLSTHLEGDFTFEDYISVLLSAIHGQAENFISGIEEDKREELRATVYDSLNFAFKAMLDQIIPPEDTPLGNLTEEAIMRAENELIQERYNALTDEEKEAPVTLPVTPVQVNED